MKLIYDTETKTEVIDLEVRCLDDEDLIIENTDGYGQTDINLFGSYMTWKQLDIVKKGIALAEKQWRK